jgi:hypothetical protein
MRNAIVLSSLTLILGALALPQRTQAIAAPAPAAHYAGGAALVIFMFGGLDIFGLQAPKKAQTPEQLEFQALSIDAGSLGSQSAAGSMVLASELGLSELNALGHDRSLADQIGR